MRRLPINLASEPVEAVRRAWRVVGIAAAALAGLTLIHVLVLAWVTAGAAEDPAMARGPAVPLETMRQWQQEVQELSAVADVQRARQAAAAVELGNQVLAWHAIPWGALFSDLEGLMPDRVRLEAIQPAVGEASEVRVSMTAAANDAAPLQELLIVLEDSPLFHEVLPQREDLGPDGMLRMQLLARYVPAEGPAGEVGR